MNCLDLHHDVVDPLAPGGAGLHLGMIVVGNVGQNGLLVRLQCLLDEVAVG